MGGRDGCQETPDGNKVLAASGPCFGLLIGIEFAPLKHGLRAYGPRASKNAVYLEQIMYAVIESGGKQHRVVEGETLRLEKLDAATGDSIDFDRVLMVGEGDSVKVGAPYVDGGKVTAEVVSHGRGEKVRIIKFRRRKHHRKQQGHRQWYTEVKITGINAG